MSEAEPEADGADDQEEQADEQTETEPTFYERVDEVLAEGDVDALAEEDAEDLTDVEKEAVEVAALEQEHTTQIDTLDDSQATHDELDRLYNDEGLSLVDIGRLFRTTDATVQRRMEQHELERRGSRNEIPEEDLVEAYIDLACELSGADTADELAELVEEGEATMPTTTQMGEQGPHSAHTFYNYFDGWEDVKQNIYDEIGAQPPEDEDEDEETEGADSDESDDGE